MSRRLLASAYVVRCATVALFAAVSWTAGCGRSSTGGPPPPGPTGPSGSTYSSIHVSVRDLLNRDIPGAIVKILDGPAAGATVVANQDGVAIFQGSFDVGKTLTIEASSGTMARTVTYTPSDGLPYPATEVFLQSADNVAIQTGDYTVTIDPGDGCQEIPDGLRVRAYAATVSPVDASGRYLVKLAGQFLDTGLDPSVPPGAFDLTAFGHDFGIPAMDGDFLTLAWEKVTPTVGLYTQIYGFPMTTASGPSVSSFTLPVNRTSLEYCEVQTGGDLSSDCQYPGFVRHVTCISNNGRVIFTHR